MEIVHICSDTSGHKRLLLPLCYCLIIFFYFIKFRDQLSIWETAHFSQRKKEKEFPQVVQIINRFYHKCHQFSFRFQASGILR